MSFDNFSFSRIKSAQCCLKIACCMKLKVPTYSIEKLY